MKEIFTYYISQFRATLQPFLPKVATQYIIISLVLMLFCSIGLQGYVFTKYSYSMEIHQISNISFKMYTCKSHFTVKERFIKSIVQFAIGFWIPLVLTIVCHILMYKKLLEQLQFRRSSILSINPREQLRRLSLKFAVIICAFYICILPLTIVETYVTYYKYQGLDVVSTERYNMLLSLCTLLMDFNSCLNPLIYANLHERLCYGVRWLFDVLSSFHRRLLKIYGRHCTLEISSLAEIGKGEQVMVELTKYTKTCNTP